MLVVIRIPSFSTYRVLTSRAVTMSTVVVLNHVEASWIQRRRAIHSGPSRPADAAVNTGKNIIKYYKCVRRV